jgi:hypothetical protein
LLLPESASLEARPAAANVGAVQEALNHAVEVMVAVGQLLAGDRAGDGIAEQEDAKHDPSRLLRALARRRAFVRAFAAVGPVVNDDQNIH